MKAEIMWVLRSVETNQSFSSQAGISDYFSAMFPDSLIAKHFTCAESKSRYMTIHGLGVYLQQLLRDKVKNEKYVLLFDESLNKQLQKKQMDVHLRFWNGGLVQTRYATSCFLGHGDAATIVSALKESVLSLGLSLEKLMQIGMDGPNVNWKVFSDLSDEIRVERGTDLLNVGSCGLHVVHGAFKDALETTKWEIDSILKAAYHLFNNTPARRDDFQALTGCTLFPLKHAPHRWVENVAVLERMIEILPQLCQYLKAVKEKRLPNPGTHSSSVLMSECFDRLLVVKLKFFLNFAKIVQPFLVTFQTDKPALPFIVVELSNMIGLLLEKFVQGDKVQEVGKAANLRREEYAKPENHKQVDLGFAAEKSLRDVGKKVTESAIIDLRRKAKDSLLAFIKKLVEKSPLAYPLARSLVCLSPVNMNSKPEESKKLFRRVLLILVEKGKLSEVNCDKVEADYGRLLGDAGDGERGKTFREFDYTQDRLDVFLCDKAKQYPSVLEVIKDLLLLSHGQATVERGFSFNKEVVVENQERDSLVARRLVKDHITAAGGSRNVAITKQMISYARSSYNRYNQHLLEEKEKKAKEQRGKKRKAEEDAIADLQAQKVRLVDDIEALYKGVKDFAIKCEKTGNITFITQSNALREKAEQKEKALKELETDIADKLKSLRQQ